MPPKQALPSAIWEALDHPGNEQHLQVMANAAGQQHMLLRATGRRLGVRPCTATSCRIDSVASAMFSPAR
jgi:hypothetical protein